ncbi:MAG: hypothetical protein HFI30_03920 [Lachnospiraceae bacterium]|jgi:hypothetical protein|nr:hypothetical protein [Lachnospiraceae bacterium]MCI8994824.1 hypothetical protein [Lachnospiraceae bacterium]
MRHKESTYLLAGILFTLFLGSLSHFFYEWSGEHPLVGLFSPVNESVWEHMKLVFFPALLYTLFEIIARLRLDSHFLTVRFLSLLTGTFLIPCLFFIYTGFLGRPFLPLDIGIFVLCTLTVFLLSHYLDLNAKALSLPFFVLFTALLFFLILFFSFSYRPPNLPLFWPPKNFLWLP